MNYFVKFLVIFVILQHYSTKVESIRCFQCNSNNNSGCSTLKNYGKDLFHPIPCDEDPNKNAFCRKTIIKVIEKGKQHEPRVIRSCGYIPYKKPCYRADNEGHTEIVCQCFEDGCNSANSFKISIILTSMFSIITSLKLF